MGRFSKEPTFNGRAGRDKAHAAIVIGIDCIQGLQSARILSQRDVRVIGIAKNRSHYACSTKACDELFIADTGGEGVVELLLEIGPRFAAKPVLFPCQDKNVITISRNKESLDEWYHVMLPDTHLVEMMMDKSKFYPFATANGFPLTPTFLLRDLPDAREVATEIGYPAILKPSLRLREWSKHTREKAVMVNDATELLREYDRLSPWTAVLIAQEYIPGPDTNHFTVNCYFGRDGAVLATVTTQKLRQWPVSTGQACLSREARNDEALSETLRLFESVGLQGLAYLEMKRHDRSNRYFIIEPNIGRPTGRSATAEAAGVELLYTMYCDAVGLSLPEERTQKFVGVKWIHLVRDLQASLHHIARGELTIRGWWLSLRGPRIYAIFSLRDPVPFLKAIASTVAQGISDRFRIHRRPVAPGPVRDIVDS